MSRRTSSRELRKAAARRRQALRGSDGRGPRWPGSGEVRGLPAPNAKAPPPPPRWEAEAPDSANG